MEHLARASIAACAVALMGVIYTVLPYTQPWVVLVVAGSFVLVLAVSLMMGRKPG